MRRKAFVSLLEIVAALIILIVAFSVLFPGFNYQNRWSNALISLKARDAVLVLDRTGSLHSHSFNGTNMKNFLDRTVPINETNLISWTGVKGTFKPTVVVGCDCTQQEINALNSWMRLNLNNRTVDFDFVHTSLDPIDSSTDVLLIWGDKNLAQYENNLRNYLRSGNGIVEIMDLKTSLDSVQKSIFGIEKCSEIFGSSNCEIGSPPHTENNFVKPEIVKRPSYQTYKNFHHIPMSLWAPNFVTSFDNGLLEPCVSNDITQGNFNMRGTIYKFWICGQASVYFDTNGDDEADVRVLPGQSFTIDNQGLLLSYIDTNVKVGVSFPQGYDLRNFLEPETTLYPSDRDVFRIVTSRSNYTNSLNQPSQNPIPAAIVNGTVSKVAWMPDFSRGLDLGLEADRNRVGDDQKLLLGSLLLWASDKNYASGLSNLRLGHRTSYINVVNQDMFEVYEFELGFGFPF